MTTDKLSKEIINSNLNDNAKIELLKQIILKDVLTPTVIKIGDPSGWWKQHMMDGTADSDRIIHPLATCNT